MNRDFTTTMIIGLFLLTSSITLQALNNPRTEGFIGKTVHSLEKILFSQFPTNLSSKKSTTTYTKITACDGTGVIESSNGVPDATNAEGTQDASYASLHETNDEIILDLGDALSATTMIDIIWRRTSGSQSEIAVFSSTAATSSFVEVSVSPYTITTQNVVLTQTVSIPAGDRYLRILSLSLIHI